MKISNEIAIHEAGHLVVGLRIGIDEQGIAFRSPGPGQAAGAWCRHPDRNLLKAIIRSFSGLLAHIHLLPDSIAPDLRRAYAHSIIIDSEHPCFRTLAPSDREFLSGTRDDMDMAWAYALNLNGNNQKQALAYLREAERKTRSLVIESADNISRVADDIQVWSIEPDRKDDYLLLYPPHRAKAAMKKI
jgi:hypothetical protein